MFKKLIWPTKATPTQDRSEQLILPVPELVGVVIIQRVADAIIARVSRDVPANHARLLCKALLESAPQLASADEAQCICEGHGAVFTHAVGHLYSVAESRYFYGADFLIEHYSALGHWIESKLGELDSVCLDFVEANAPQPFAVCVCY